MNPVTALTAKPLSPAQRQALVEELVSGGKLTRRQAGLIRFDEAVPASIQNAAREVVPAARRSLARKAA